MEDTELAMLAIWKLQEAKMGAGTLADLI